MMRDEKTIERAPMAVDAPLPLAIGDARAKELILFGQMFTAEDGIAWGIGGETVEVDLVLERSIALARQLAQGPTVAFAESKRLILEGSGSGIEAALEAEAVAQVRCGATADHVGAVYAFLDREKPTFAVN